MSESRIRESHWRHALLGCVIFGFCTAMNPAIASEQAARSKLAIDINVYPYLDEVQEDTDLTLVFNAPLPGRFSYFSYVNARGLFTGSDFTFTRSEQNLRWAISEKLPIDLAVQAILVEGNGFDVWQLGISWRANDTLALKTFFERLNLKYRLTLHVKRYSSASDDGWQMEHFFLMKFPGISDRLYLSGFLDQTFGLDLPDTLPSKPIVTEIQLGARLFNRFYVVAEYRRNEFRVSRENNLAVGVEYKFRW